MRGFIVDEQTRCVVFVGELTDKRQLDGAKYTRYAIRDGVTEPPTPPRQHRVLYVDGEFSFDPLPDSRPVLRRDSPTLARDVAEILANLGHVYLE